MTLALIATMIATAYGLACWLLPFGTCRACRGAGARPHRLTGRLRPCRRCRSSGMRLRVGRAVWNHAARIHRDATTTRHGREGGQP
ncbi:hypothetical protein GCM10010123_44310 [Pilimelia anulata]|uniref:Uncharacterized protein n=1 Tax=Pilimelia anulata TaxID=53371 RepID=A0A8J3BB88_9ACTN|nr:hypothetical protein [Pilimelia anulata]GGK09562.1 hypothetical protein GCM10010123_44310 [Pilimelia anulata]